ncbi:MAG: nuclear transport factor 2 family protein [Acidimicrobiales bacterium]
MTDFLQRPTTFRGVTELAGWSLKIYELAATPDPIDESNMKAALDTSRRIIPDRPAGGLGFVIVHRGTEAIWVLVDTWHAEIINQRTYRADLDTPTELVAVPAGGPTMCVWELEIIDHERRSYTNHILAPGEMQIDAYLADGYRPSADEATRTLIERFNQAWTEGDSEQLMDTMHAQPTYSASTGPEPGRTYAGHHEVSVGFADVMAAEAAAADPSHPPPEDQPLEIVVAGDRGLSYWSYPTTSPDGSPAVVHGVDVWTVVDGKLAHKDAYRKAYPEHRGDE